MAGEFWTSILSLTGVVLGSALTAFTQRSTQRSIERTEERRQASATAEARRAEQLQAIKEFIACAQEAERAAYRRPEPWGDDEKGWMTQTQAIMTALWTAERTLVLLCDETLQDPVHVYGRALNQAVWRDIGETEVNEFLEAKKTEFMAAARASLASC